MNSLNNETPVIIPIATHGIGIENISVESSENNARKRNINIGTFLSTILFIRFNSSVPHLSMNRSPELQHYLYGN